MDAPTYVATAFRKIVRIGELFEEAILEYQRNQIACIKIQFSNGMKVVSDSWPQLRVLFGVV